MEVTFLKDLIVIIGLSIVVLLVGHRFRIPPIVGFLLTGVLAGPHGFGLIRNIDDVDALAEIGIILLLFGIGMELSLKKLGQMKKLLFLGGSLQVGFTILCGMALGYIFGSPWKESIFLGCLISMSSTAIVLRLFEQRGETTSPQGQLSTSILIYQDIVAIPMLLLTPVLASMGDEHGQGFNPDFLYLLAKGVVVLFMVFFSAERIVPPLLLLVARTRNKDLFLLTVLGLCFGVASLTSSLGLSLTIGAFMAGLIISESEYSNEAIGNIFPFQALFISFFFVSIGMLLDLQFVVQQPLLILAGTIGIMLLKTMTGGVATTILGLPLRTAVLVGIALSQVGEFAFVLAKAGLQYHLIMTDYHYQLFLAISFFTMALTPICVYFSPKIADLFNKMPLPEKVKMGAKGLPFTKNEPLENHVVIVGFGISGKNLARSSKAASIPYLVLEMNPDTVREYKRLGEPIYFGDASHTSVLEHVHITKAKALAILVNDPIAARNIVKKARESSPNLYIIVRTRYLQESPLMMNLGADEVIPDEFGTSVEILTRVLRQYHVPHNEIDKVVEELREEGYKTLYNQNNAATKLSDIKLGLSHVNIASFRVEPTSQLVDKTLMESDLRKHHGATVILIRRNMEVISNPSPDVQFQVNDIVVLMGEQGPLKEVANLFVATATMKEEYVQ